MSWADAVIETFAENMTLKRNTPGEYDSSGRYIEGMETQTTIRGSIQPATQEDLRMLPEGRRVDEGMKLYTTTPLLTASPNNETNADIINYREQDFEVVAVRDWVKTTSFYRAILRRLGDG
jgi:hypothetical protein